MLATMGSVTLEFTCKLPSYLPPAAGLKFADIPNGLGALSTVPAAGWAQIVAYSASASCPKTSPLALPRPQATSVSKCWSLHPPERQKKLLRGSRTAASR